MASALTAALKSQFVKEQTAVRAMTDSMLFLCNRLCGNKSNSDT